MRCRHQVSSFWSSFLGGVAAFCSGTGVGAVPAGGGAGAALTSPSVYTLPLALTALRRASSFLASSASEGFCANTPAVEAETSASSSTATGRRLRVVDLLIGLSWMPENQCSRRPHCWLDDPEEGAAAPDSSAILVRTLSASGAEGDSLRYSPYAAAASRLRPSFSRLTAYASRNDASSGDRRIAFSNSATAAASSPALWHARAR